MEAPLSALLPANPRSARRLVAASKGLTVIDPLPQAFHALEYLDLSGNAIHSLVGLRNLTRLRALVLCENRVAALRELKNLEPLEALEEADFRGNPVTAYFGYRDTVILACQSLVLLDSEEVTESEAVDAERRISQRDKFVSAILSNEESISKLEHLQRRLRLHSEMLANGQLVEHCPVNVGRLLASFSLDWPDSLIADIAESLEARVSARLSGSQRDWKSLYAECVDKQQQLMGTLMRECEHLAQEEEAMWANRGSHARDWSLGPRLSNDLGLETLGFELESVLSEHQHLKETTLVQQRQLAAILARNEELEECLSTLKSRSGDTLALHSTIDDGITLVVERFRDQHRLKQAFDSLSAATSALRRQRLFAEEIADRQRSEVGTLCFAAWKWATKIEKFMEYKDSERREARLREATERWKWVCTRNSAAREIAGNRQFRVVARLFQAWSVYPLVAKDRRLKKDSAALQYSRSLVLRVLQSWSQACGGSLPTRYWRDIHAEKVQLRCLLALRTKALASRSLSRRADSLARSSLAHKAVFALRSFMFLTAKKRQLLQRIHEFMTLKAMRRLQRNRLERRYRWRNRVRAQQHYITSLLAKVLRVLTLWSELSRERAKRLSRLVTRTTNLLAKRALIRWKQESSIPDFLNHTMSVVICKRGYVLGRKVIKYWKKLTVRRLRLEIAAHIWQSRARVKALSQSLVPWLCSTVAVLRARVAECRTETTRLENSLTGRESEAKALHTHKLRFQLEDSPDTKRTVEDLTSRPDARKIQLLESELTALRTEVATLRAQRTDRASLEGLKKELASARALCTSLTSELQRTTSALQSQQAEFHLQANELTEQLSEARSQLQRTTRENRELKDKLKDSLYLDLSRTQSQESSRLGPELTVSPRIGLDSEERRVRQQLESLKRERTAIRGEIETRLRDLEDSRSAMSTPGPTLSSLGELSVRLSQLESRMTARH